MSEARPIKLRRMTQNSLREHWKPKVLTENTDFYIHLKERQKIVR